MNRKAAQLLAHYKAKWAKGPGRGTDLIELYEAGVQHFDGLDLVVNYDENGRPLDGALIRRENLDPTR